MISSHPSRLFDDRVPPQNLLAEQSTLGSMLQDSAALEIGLGLLVQEDFYREAHQRIFAAMQGMASRGVPVDLVTLVEELKNRGILEAIGHVVYLTVLLDSIPTTANAEYYAKIVRKDSILRQTIAISKRMQEAAFSGDMETIRDLSLLPVEELSPNGSQSAPGNAWPTLHPNAFYGLAGDLVAKIAPHTEADPAALLSQFLVAYGNVIGRSAHWRVGKTDHFLNLYAVIVGVSSNGRKGTSWDDIRGQIREIEFDWEQNRISKGMNSGEGFIWAVRDAIEKIETIREKGKSTGETETVVVDPGVSDKRLMIVESEFASVLKVMTREQNTLSMLIREAWETGNLQSMTKNSPARTTGAHVSIIGHVTKDELLRYLTDDSAANGFGNRFLFFCAKRSNVLPRGGWIEREDFSEIQDQLRLSIEYGRLTGLMEMTEEAWGFWESIYERLSDSRFGMFGAIIGRAVAQVRRLACIYSLLDCSDVVGLRHLEAGLAVWQYCEDSARFIFGDSQGDPLADNILQIIRNAPEGINRTGIHQALGKNKEASLIQTALSLLLERGLITQETERTEGRPSLVYKPR